ncbi:MAG: hypothetical protein Q8N16_02465 [bacterium]|nr:hypothetical protein [bacterium]
MKEKVGKVIFIIIFWTILFGLLGGLDLIKDMFSIGFLWVFIIVRQGLILLLIVVPLYLIFNILKSKNEAHERKN